MSILMKRLKEYADVMTRGCRSDDPRIARLQILALDDDEALAVYADWCLDRVRPEWQDNPHYRTEWWRHQVGGGCVSLFGKGARYRLDNACADIVFARTGEAPRVVPTPEAWSLRDDEVIVESWAGRVCEMSSAVERIMSDVYATVRYAHVLTLNGEPRKICVSNDEFAPLYPTSFGGGRATVDASAEVLAAYQAGKDRAAAEAEAQRERAQQEERLREARTPRRGKRVRVVRGRKVPRGTEGTVGWYGEGKWGGWRVGIDTDDGRVWTNANNVEVI